MKRSLKQRMLITVAATLVAALCGYAVAYWIGYEIALRLSAGRLGREAALAIVETETYARDDHAALDAMNASSIPHCSPEDMDFLHRLLYHLIFVKELGRIRDNRILCSTTIGRDHLSSVELPKPESIGSDGVRVYRDPQFFGWPNDKVVALQDGDSYVVLYPFFEIHQDSAPMQIATTVVGPERKQPLLVVNGAPQPSWPQRTMNSDFRIGSFLYSTRCSLLSIDHICITAYLSVPDALALNRGEMKAMVVMGGPIGGFFGFLVALLYRRNRSLESQLRRAIHKDQLRFVYQPIVALESGEIVGAEALARWSDEDGVNVPPDQFIKIAEQNDLVGEITRLAVHHASHDFAQLIGTHPGFHLSVNVAAADLADPHFLPMLDEEILRVGMKPENLSIEITESSTALREAAIDTIRQLHERGHQVHIDDFGTGYSSLSYLNDLSVDAIKIDRSFTQAIGTESVTLSILPQILSMAEALHLRVIVEGIETCQQSGFFRSSATQHILGQGWLFGRPVTAEQFYLLLADNERSQEAIAAGTESRRDPCAA
jgi:sensor c-di-GMP phosphodiesterase-like protein